MYRNFHTYFWSDPKIKKWPAMARYHFAYLFTNEHTNLSGIYKLKLLYMQDDLGVNKKTVTDNLELFAKENVALYDYEREIVWVVKMLFHQTHGNPGSKNLRGIASHLETLHNSPLIRLFLQKYKDLDIPYTIPDPTISTMAGYPPDPVPVPDSVIKGKSEGVTKSVTEKRIHIDNLPFTDSMKAYAAEHEINGHAIDLFGDMVRWANKNNKLTNTLRGWEAQYQTFVRKAPEMSPKYIDHKPAAEYQESAIRRAMRGSK